MSAAAVGDSSRLHASVWHLSLPTRCAAALTDSYGYRRAVTDNSWIRALVVCPDITD